MGNSPIAPLDLIAADSLLSPEEREIRSTVRRWLDDNARPHLAKWYEYGDLPVREIAQGLGQLGVLGMHLEGYGCAGQSAVAYGLACMELEAADSGLRSLVSVQGSLAMFALYAFGSDDQREQWLPNMAAGRAIGCFGLTEADAGSDPSSMRTRAVQDGDHWVLNGSKMWITNGTVADVADDLGLVGLFLYSPDAVREALDYRTTRTIDDGIQEVLAALRSGKIDPDDRRGYTLRQYVFLREAELAAQSLAMNGHILGSA